MPQQAAGWAQRPLRSQMYYRHGEEPGCLPPAMEGLRDDAGAALLPGGDPDQHRLTTLLLLDLLDLLGQRLLKAF